MEAFIDKYRKLVNRKLEIVDLENPNKRQKKDAQEEYKKEEEKNEKV